jgi:hypothetical protein
MPYYFTTKQRPEKEKNTPLFSFCTATEAYWFYWFFFTGDAK